MFQQTTIIGHLGGDPEMRYTGTGVPVTSYSVATKKSWTGNDGVKQEKTVWFRVSSWNKQAEIVAQYLKKGSKVHVIGEIEEPRVFTDRDGNARASLELRAHTVTFLDSKNEGGGNYSLPAAAPAATQSSVSSADENIPF